MLRLYSKGYCRIEIIVFIIFLSTYSLLISCVNKNVSYNDLYKDNTDSIKDIKLVEAGSKKWKLDKDTDPLFTSSFYDVDDSTYYYLNEGNLIKCHFGDSLAIRTNNIYPLTSFCVHKDTVWGVCYSSNEIRKHVSGKLVDSYKVRSDAKYPPCPRIGISPFIVNDSVISYFGNISGEVYDENSINRPTLTKYYRNIDKFENSIGYPDIYHEGNWGGGMLRWVYATYNPKNDFYVVSFPISHDIEVWKSGKNKVLTAYAGSKRIEKIESFSANKFKVPSGEEILRYINDNCCYANIFYDLWNNLYYRIAELSNSEGSIDNGIHKNISIIIMDGNFNKVGETDIPAVGRFYRYSTFVSQEGLMIPVDTIEDYLSYKIYRPQKCKSE